MLCNMSSAVCLTVSVCCPQSALGMLQMLEDTLIEHAHTKPLLPSQLIRYREVQVPDGKCSASQTPVQHLSWTQTQSFLQLFQL